MRVILENKKADHANNIILFVSRTVLEFGGYYTIRVAATYALYVVYSTILSTDANDNVQTTLTILNNMIIR